MVVVADSPEEEREIEKEILDKAALLQKFGLHEEDGLIPQRSGSCQAAGRSPAATAADGAVAGEARRHGGVDGTCEYYVVVQSALREAEALLQRGGAESVPDALLEQLLDVPEELCGGQGAGPLPNRLAILDSYTHPELCVRLHEYLEGTDEESNQPDVESSGASTTDAEIDEGATASAASSIGNRDAGGAS
eukprot:gnl/TRDRNA2_/TRDRNA2_136117_c3_seq2.p1 gnl/TRDRNA2_/TRDRNA2_136117_c3~~gnl/TRDRNA2_/TRDRNA2_136117_c3_seq2.p1  ORF type:complete len:208 (+),score=53.68 gnl/TRDRNA2_/TRDRNA2_136117_c3_seq2:50-625(+)